MVGSIPFTRSIDYEELTDVCSKSAVKLLCFTEYILLDSFLVAHRERLVVAPGRNLLIFAPAFDSAHSALQS